MITLDTIPTDVLNAREQTAHREEWHARHAASEPTRKERRQSEPLPIPTRIMLVKGMILKHILFCRERGLLRHLSWLFWLDAYKTAKRWWSAAMWMRGAYQYARWWISRGDSIEAIAHKNGVCHDCAWRDEVDGVQYCDACICPKKPHAAIVRKNTRTYPHCPKGYHPGSRVDPYAKVMPCVTCGSKKDGSTALARSGDGRGRSHHGNDRRHAQ